MRLLSSAVLFAILALAQIQTPPGEQAIIRVDTRLVDLPVSVTDKSGRLVTDLPQKAFKVFENGVEQPIKVFKRADVPISLGIIVDNSGSMKEKRQKVETASLDLVKASNPNDEVFVVNFNDVAYLDVPMTNNVKALEE